ncbi:AAA-type ATPase lid domain-containing protein [Elstera litoralis]
MDFLGTELPPLRDRLEDLPALIVAALADHGYAKPEIVTPDLLAACRAYPWPENGFELDRVIARLAVMTDGAPITDADIRQHAPWMLPAPAHGAPEEPPPPNRSAPDHATAPTRAFRILDFMRAEQRCPSPRRAAPCPQESAVLLRRTLCSAGFFRRACQPRPC